MSLKRNLMKNYRKKIYKYYSNYSGRSLAPNDINGLRSRESFFKKIINNFFPNDKSIKIVGIGCGYGAFQYFIQQAGYRNSIGVDGSQWQVNEPKRLNIQNVVFDDLVDYLKKLGDSSLDLLIAIVVIEHFTKEELSDLLDDINRVLKKDGVVITHQPNGESPFCGSIRYGNFTHELSFTRNSISQIFLSSKFSSVKSYEDTPIVHGLKSYIRLFLWEFLIKPIYKLLLVVESGGVDNDIILTKNFLTVVKK